MAVTVRNLLIALYLGGFDGAFLLSDSDQVSFSLHKKIIQKEHRKECLSAVERLFGDCPSIKGDFIVINFFSLVLVKRIKHALFAFFILPYHILT